MQGVELLFILHACSDSEDHLKCMEDSCLLDSCAGARHLEKKVRTMTPVLMEEAASHLVTCVEAQLFDKCL